MHGNTVPHLAESRHNIPNTSLRLKLTHGLKARLCFSAGVREPSEDDEDAKLRRDCCKAKIAHHSLPSTDSFLDAQECSRICNALKSKKYLCTCRPPDTVYARAIFTKAPRYATWQETPSPTSIQPVRTRNQA